ncbi:unnamed protein product [Phytophthora lilii]|uniref:protein-histidine N-methyltransferase n=1 Tax=Phytophthora lilii TaxID=2077276 RepID=A0A9W6TY50_9STRA|nr:unnamed protein product [Phytophthora lilii]
MSFSFNFALGGAAPTPAAAVTSPAAAHPKREGERFVCAAPEAVTAFSPAPVGDLSFEIVATTAADFLARTGAIRSVLSTSDVQTGVYEGGFKLWECAVDLVQFVETQLRQGGAMPADVLELGCGHGLPGIHALQRGAERVVFSDYNKEVLELTTCPNLLRNVGEEKYRRAEFYAGAWSSVSRYMQDVERLSPEQMQFDLILTAETIYTEAVAVELYQVGDEVAGGLSRSHWTNCCAVNVVGDQAASTPRPERPCTGGRQKVLLRHERQRSALCRPRAGGRGVQGRDRVGRARLPLQHPRDRATHLPGELKVRFLEVLAGKIPPMRTNGSFRRGQLSLAMQRTSTRIEPLTRQTSAPDVVSLPT